MSRATSILLRYGLLAVAWLALCGAARIEMVARLDAGAGQRYVALSGAIGAQELLVRRGERVLAVRTPFALQSGDEIETGAHSVAIVHFPGTGDAYLDARTRVRVGSLDVQFGRIFARVKGLFSVESETVVAGVEGTEFAMIVRPRQSVGVVVLDGAVTCRSPSRRWGDQRLSARQSLLVDYPGRSAPRVWSTHASDLNQLRAWAARVEAAQRAQRGGRA